MNFVGILKTKQKKLRMNDKLSIIGWMYIDLGSIKFIFFGFEAKRIRLMISKSPLEHWICV